MSTEKQMSKTFTKITLDWLNHKLMLSSPSVMNLNKKINLRKEKEDNKLVEYKDMFERKQHTN